MKKLVLLSLLLAAIGCGGSSLIGQVPPTTWQINYTWQVPAPTSSWGGCGAGQPACSYVISTLMVPGTTVACPIPSSTVVYTPVNQASPVTDLSYLYLGAQPGVAICAVVQTVQNGSYSLPSAPSNVVDVPVTPGSPSTAAGSLQQQAAIITPKIEGTELSSLGTPGKLVALVSQ